MKTMQELPRIAISMGDPAGVGPEVVVKALARPQVHEICRPVVIGEAHVLEKACAVATVEPAGEWHDMGCLSADEHQWGRVSANCGRAGASYVERAVAMAQAGEAGAIVTGPLNKEALNLAEVPFPGHTEMLAALTDSSDYAMMLVAPALRVIHVSTHVSLEEAIRRVRRPRIAKVIALADEALRLEGVEAPRIAVAGLNPHAGEGGLFGDQEREDVAPAIEEAREAGIDATGPHPPDTIFWHARQGRYDIVVAMYHDQGHIPIKLAGFDDAVNVTVGLPILRASVDHGTAFDIAGKGIASESSMIAALSYAARLAR